MKSRTLMCIIATSLLFALAIPGQLNAQHTRYRLIDLGTFGGPSSYLAGSNGVNDAVNQVLNNQGTVVGWGDTSTLDPFAPNCFEPFPNGDCFLPLPENENESGSYALVEGSPYRRREIP
jgi:hypothetical protein